MQVNERAQEWWSQMKALPIWILDGLIATVLLVTGLVSMSTPMGSTVGFTPLDTRAYVLAIAVTVPFYFRRQAPFTVFVVSTTALVTYSSLGYHEGGLPTAVLIAVYTVGAYCPPRVVVGTYVLTLFAMLPIIMFGRDDFGSGELIQNAAVFGFGITFGWTVQSRRLRLEEAEERAELLRREQAEEAARAVADERLRIAQELHDVVAHSMSVIAVQAGVGMHVVDADPAEAKVALQHISATSRSTLTELRRLLGVLRDDGSGASYAPAPGLEDLAELAREVDGAGVPVDVDTDGSLTDVPPGVGFTGYRIVQEALTNVLKHAGPSHASVHVANDAGTLRIEVSDDGRGVNGRAPGTGHGLVGMRERVAVYGGTLEAGPKPGGGYRVTAVLPYDANANASADEGEGR